jgi:hypothetical protein
MIMKKICYTIDGRLHIVHPVPKANIEKLLGPLTDDEYRNHIYEKSIPTNAKNVREIEDSEIPNNRTFRNAWEYQE